MKLRKIVTMGMATLMAVSAMSLSAFACENPEDAIISVLAPDGENRLYLSQEDIDNGITTVTGYQGIEVTANPDNKIEVFNSTVTPRILSSTYFKGTNIPTSSKSIEDGSYMELPNYRMPGAKNVGHLLWDKAKDFLHI